MNCPTCDTAIDETLTRQGHGLHTGCDPIARSADEVAGELFTLIADAIEQQPRSQQTRIGPSEIGVECDRRIGYKLAGVPEVNRKGVPWKPYVGTAIHEQLSNVMAAAELASLTAGNSPRWHVEERVSVGEVDGVEITGSCDLYDAHTGTVFDWKTTSWNQIRETYRPHGPGPQYRAQAHLYGRGWARRGYPVTQVALVFLVRDGGFDQRHVWSEQYDEQIAITALERLAVIQRTIGLGGTAALELLPTADSHCTWCPYFKARSTNIPGACPGHPVSNTATPITQSLTELIGA